MLGSHQIILKAYQPNQRHRYILEQVFQRWLGLDCDLIPHDELTLSISVSQSTEGDLTWPDSPILRDLDTLTDWHGVLTDHLTRLQSDDADPMNIDVFGLIFFLLASHEQYTATERDTHGRRPASASILFLTGWLERPVIDEIITWLKVALASRFGISFHEMPPYRLRSTIDIDHPWHTRHLRWPYRLKHYIKGQSPDPYEQYATLASLHHSAGLTPLYFVSPPADTRHDFIKKYRLEPYQKLITDLAAQHDVGLHPSYDSGSDADRMASEFAWIETVLGRRVSSSRQHYLRTAWPMTYRQLLQCGVSDDFSLAYADHIGYASGTARPYRWYDLLREQPTALEIHPTAAMDVTLRYRMGLTPRQAYDRLMTLHDHAERHGGEFVLLWHNSSLSKVDGWEAYAEMYHAFILAHKRDH